MKEELIFVKKNHEITREFACNIFETKKSNENPHKNHLPTFLDVLGTSVSF